MLVFIFLNAPTYRRDIHIMRIPLKLFVLLAVILLVFVFFIKKQNDSPFQFEVSDPRCSAYQRIQFLVLEGVVDSVFEDADNHSQNTLKINVSESIQTVYLEFDKSDLFNYLQKGDSIFKKYKDYEVHVKRNVSKKTFLLDFGCEKENP